MIVEHSLAHICKQLLGLLMIIGSQKDCWKLLFPKDKRLFKYSVRLPGPSVTASRSARAVSITKYSEMFVFRKNGVSSSLSGRQ